VPVRSALEGSGKFLRETAAPAVRSAVPKPRENAPRTTARDVSTVGLSTALLNIIVWGFSVGDINIPDHVAVSIAAIVTYFIARKFEY
jgi:hypothetical protein